MPGGPQKTRENHRKPQKKLKNIIFTCFLQFCVVFCRVQAPRKPGETTENHQQPQKTLCLLVFLQFCIVFCRVPIRKNRPLRKPLPRQPHRLKTCPLGDFDMLTWNSTSKTSQNGRVTKILGVNPRVPGGTRGYPGVPISLASALSLTASQLHNI